MAGLQKKTYQKKECSLQQHDQRKRAAASHAESFMGQMTLSLLNKTPLHTNDDTAESRSPSTALLCECSLYLPGYANQCRTVSRSKLPDSSAQNCTKLALVYPVTLQGQTRIQVYDCCQNSQNQNNIGKPPHELSWLYFCSGML